MSRMADSPPKQTAAAAAARGKHTSRGKPRTRLFITFPRGTNLTCFSRSESIRNAASSTTISQEGRQTLSDQFQDAQLRGAEAAIEEEETFNDPFEPVATAASTPAGVFGGAGTSRLPPPGPGPGLSDPGRPSTELLRPEPAALGEETFDPHVNLTVMDKLYQLKTSRPTMDETVRAELEAIRSAFNMSKLDFDQTLSLMNFDDGNPEDDGSQDIVSVPVQFPDPEYTESDRLEERVNAVSKNLDFQLGFKLCYCLVRSIGCLRDGTPKFTLLMDQSTMDEYFGSEVQHEISTLFIKRAQAERNFPGILTDTWGSRLVSSLGQTLQDSNQKPQAGVFVQPDARGAKILSAILYRMSTQFPVKKIWTKLNVDLPDTAALLMYFNQQIVKVANIDISSSPTPLFSSASEYDSLKGGETPQAYLDPFKLFGILAKSSELIHEKLRSDSDTHKAAKKSIDKMGQAALEITEDYHGLPPESPGVAARAALKDKISMWEAERENLVRFMAAFKRSTSAFISIAGTWANTPCTVVRCFDALRQLVNGPRRQEVVIMTNVFTSSTDRTYNQFTRSVLDIKTILFNPGPREIEEQRGTDLFNNRTSRDRSVSPSSGASSQASSSRSSPVSTSRSRPVSRAQSQPDQLPASAGPQPSLLTTISANPSVARSLHSGRYVDSFGPRYSNISFSGNVAETPGGPARSRVAQSGGRYIRVRENSSSNRVLLGDGGSQRDTRDNESRARRTSRDGRYLRTGRSCFVNRFYSGSRRSHHSDEHDIQAEVNQFVSKVTSTIIAAENKIKDQTIVMGAAFKVTIDRLKKLLDRFDAAGYEEAGVILEPVVVPGYPHEVEEALNLAMERVHVKQARVEDNRRAELKRKETLASDSVKSLPATELVKIKKRSDYLHFRTQIIGIISQSQETNSSEKLISGIKSCLPEEVCLGIRSKRSVKEILGHIHNYYRFGYVNAVFNEVFAPLVPATYNKPQQIVNNISTVLDYLSLIFKFQYTNEVTEIQVKILEEKCFPYQQRQKYLEEIQRLLESPDIENYITLISQGQNVSLDESLAGNRNDRTILRYLERADDDDSDLVLTQNDMFRGAGYVQLTTEQRLKFFTRKAEQYLDLLSQTIVESKGRSEASKTTGFADRRRDGANNFNIETTEDEVEETAMLAKGGRAGKTQPMLPCPLRSLNCKDLHRQGSAFFCKLFKNKPLVERTNLVKQNDLCKICLRRNHKTGTLCSMSEVKCKTCNQTGHNRTICLEDEDKPVANDSLNANIESEDGNGFIDGMDSDVDEANDYMMVPGSAEDSDEVPADSDADLGRFTNSLQRENKFEDPEKPDIAEEDYPEIAAAMKYLEKKISEAQKTGLTDFQRRQHEQTLAVCTVETSPEPDSTEVCMMMTSSDVENLSKIPEAPPNVREALQTITDFVSSPENQCLPQDVQDSIGGKYPGMDVHSRHREDISHLKVGPADALEDGPKGKLFLEIYQRAVECYKNSPFTKMQVIKTALELDEEQAKCFPDDHSPLENTEIFHRNNRKYLSVFALLDTGCSFVMCDKQIVALLKPPKVKNANMNIFTGNGVVSHKSHYFEFNFYNQCGEKFKISATDGNKIGLQGATTGLERKIVEEEFRMSPSFSNENMVWIEKQVRPMFLIGLAARVTTADNVNPLLLQLRPNLFNPNIKLQTCPLLMDPLKSRDSKLYFISGSFGTDPANYDIRNNCPVFLVQRQNLKEGKLDDWQRFSDFLFTDLQSRSKDIEEQNMMLTEASPEEEELEDTRYAPFVSRALDHINMMVENPAEACLTGDNASEMICSSLLVDSEGLKREASNINLEEAKTIEKYVISEAGWNTPLTLCKHHEKLIEEAGRSCPSCLTAGDPDSVRRLKLRQEIAKNLRVIPDPRRGPGQFQFVIDIVLSESPELAGHLGVSNYQTSLKASRNVVTRVKDNPVHLQVLDAQNRKYLQLDKYRILKPRTLRAIADGSVPSQFFCRGSVEKPDSLSTPVRLISGIIFSNILIVLLLTFLTVPDTSRAVWSVGRTLSSLAPSATGFTPSLASVVFRFQMHPSYIALDVSKGRNRNFRVNILTNPCLSPAYHSVRLARGNTLLFCSHWFNRVTELLCKQPYVTANLVMDFGMVKLEDGNLYLNLIVVFPEGFSHLALEAAILRACLDLVMEESRRSVEENLFIDNIGITADTEEKAVKIMEDIISTLRKYNLVIDKAYSSFALPGDGDKPATPTIMFGLVWTTGAGPSSDQLKPRVKLNIFGASRGRPRGPELAGTDLGTEVVTRRRAARLCSSLYDLTGRFLAGPISQSKLLLQKIVKTVPESSHLDYDISSDYPELASEFRNFWGSLSTIEQDIQPHPRSVLLKGEKFSYLVCSHDGSPNAIGSVVHCITEEIGTGGLFSRVFAGKSSLSKCSTPRNEKLSCLHGVQLLVQVIEAIKDKINNIQEPCFYLLGDSTISSFMFRDDSEALDGSTRAIIVKIHSALDIISRTCPKLRLKFCWVPGVKLKAVDFLTKRQTSCSIKFANSPTWRIGCELFTNPTAMTKFTYYDYQNGSGIYTELPDYLRRSVSFSHAALLHDIVQTPHVSGHQFAALLQSSPCGALARPGPPDPPPVTHSEPDSEAIPAAVDLRVTDENIDDLPISTFLQLRNQRLRRESSADLPAPPTRSRPRRTDDFLDPGLCRQLEKREISLLDLIPDHLDAGEVKRRRTQDDDPEGGQIVYETFTKEEIDSWSPEYHNAMQDLKDLKWRDLPLLLLPVMNGRLQNADSWYLDDLTFLLYPRHHVLALYQHANCTFLTRLGQFDLTSAVVSTNIALHYVTTRSGLVTRKTDPYQIPSETDYKSPLSHLRPATITVGGVKTQVTTSVSLKGKKIKFKTFERTGGRSLSYWRLNAGCYDNRSILLMWNSSIIELPAFQDKRSYLKVVNSFENIHSILNAQVGVLKFMLNLQATLKSYTWQPGRSDGDLYIAVWLKLIQADQTYYPLSSRHSGNFHTQQKVFYTQFNPETPETVNLLGSYNVPLLSGESPLARRVLMSCHKERTCFPLTSIHNSAARTRARANLGLFALTCQNLKKVTQEVLLSCHGCRRAAQKYYDLTGGPRFSRLHTTGVFRRVSFDQLGMMLVSANRESRNLVKICVYIFSCCDTRATVFVAADSASYLGAQKALAGFKLRTHCVPDVWFCDSFSSNKALKKDGYNIICHPPHSQHRNYVETSMKTVKNYFRKMLNVSAKEPNRLTSVCVADLYLMLEYIANIMNATPLSENSALTPAHLVAPALFSDLCQSQEEDVFEDFGSGKNHRRAESVLKEFQDLILKERNVVLSDLQQKFVKKRKQVKKHERTNLLPSEDDIVLWSPVPGKREKLGRIVSVSPHNTSVDLKVGGKIRKQVPVTKIRILSLFRNMNKTMSENMNADAELSKHKLGKLFHVFALHSLFNLRVKPFCVMPSGQSQSSRVRSCSSPQGKLLAVVSLAIIGSNINDFYRFHFSPAMGNILPSSVSVKFGEYQASPTGPLHQVSTYNAEEKFIKNEFLGEKWNPFITQIEHSISAYDDIIQANRQYILYGGGGLLLIFIVFSYWMIRWAKSRIASKSLPGLQLPTLQLPRPSIPGPLRRHSSFWRSSAPPLPPPTNPPPPPPGSVHLDFAQSGRHEQIYDRVGRADAGVNVQYNPGAVPSVVIHNAPTSE